jgi:hypothetical protein
VLHGVLLSMGEGRKGLNETDNECQQNVTIRGGSSRTYSQKVIVHKRKLEASSGRIFYTAFNTQNKL